MPPLVTGSNNAAGWGASLIRRNSRRRRLATRADTPEVINSRCEDTTLVETVITDDRNNPEQVSTEDSPSCPAP